MSDGPVLQLERGGKVIRRQAPVVVYYCDTPHGIRKAARCGHQAATCEGESQTCPLCRFPYCAYHLAGHRRGPYYYPKDAWRSVRKAFGQQLDRAAAATGRTVVRVKVPEVKSSD